MKKYIICCLGVLFISGCATKTPHIQEYVLHVNSKTKVYKKSRCQDKTLKILKPYSASEYMVRELHYVVEGVEQNRFNYSSLSASPSQVLHDELVKLVRESRIYGSVLGSESVAGSSEVLEIELKTFKQYFSKDLKQSHVVMDVTLSVVDTKTYKVVAQKRFVGKKDVATLDAKGGVVALSALAREELGSMIEWLAKGCQ